MKERRKHPRKGCGTGVILLDGDSGAPIGQIVDISHGGMKVHSKEPMEDMTFIRGTVRIPEAIDGKHEIYLNLRSVHSKAIESTGLYEIGFKIDRISESNYKLLSDCLADSNAVSPIR